MPSIFGMLDKQERAATDAQAAVDLDFSFEDRADLFQDLLEDDATVFPLLSCPREVLSAVLLMSNVSTSLRIRPLCRSMRSAIDGDTGLWGALILRDFADMGGRTKHYQGLRTLKDAHNDVAFTRLEWDPLMICAPAPLRYTLLAASQARRRMWEDVGHSLGTAWTWLSSKICRRMSTATFLRWGSTQHEGSELELLLGKQEDLQRQSSFDSNLLTPGNASSDRLCSEPLEGSQGTKRKLADAAWNTAAAEDIRETVKKWHTQAHKDMMREHFGKNEKSGANGGTQQQGANNTPKPDLRTFSFTPTLDAAAAAAEAADVEVARALSTNDAEGGGSRGGTQARGETSRRLEEAQLRLAIEMSKKEADSTAGNEAASTGAGTPGGEGAATQQQQRPKKQQQQQQQNAQQPGAAADEAAEPAAVARPAPAGLSLKTTTLGGPAPIVFLKPHCLADNVKDLSEGHEKSIEHVVHKLTTPATWALLYDSITEELSFRAKSAAHAVLAAHSAVVDRLVDEEISLKQERMYLPIYRSSRDSVTRLSRLRPGEVDGQRLSGRREFLKQVALEWAEMEDLTEFLDAHLGSLELAIDNFRGEAMHTSAHTPHVRDIGRLMFRNFCLLDSRIFKSLCLATYGLVQEACASMLNLGAERGNLTDLLDNVHAMLTSCDVADDHLSSGKQTKEPYVEHLVEPISAAINYLSDWDHQPVQGSWQNETKRRRTMRC